MACNCSKKITHSYSGPDMSFNPEEFLPQHVASPRGSWGTDTQNGYILHTFKLEKNCSITSGQLEVVVSRSNRGNFINDELWITHDGGQQAQHEWIWGNNGNHGGDANNGNLKNRTIILQLNEKSLASANNGSLSFLVEDDTTVVSASLQLEACCLELELEALNSCTTTVVTAPWGEYKIPVYDADSKIIISTNSNGSEASYFVEISEFDPVSWTGIDTIFSGWICFNCKIPPLLDVSHYLPPHKAINGGFKSGTHYALKVAIAEPWTEAYINFSIS